MPVKLLSISSPTLQKPLPELSPQQKKKKQNQNSAGENIKKKKDEPKMYASSFL